MIRSILIVMGATVALAACSSLPAPRPQPHPKVAATPAGCIHGTGSLVPSKRPCTALGRSYSQRQIRRTGYINLAQALQSLDPAVSATPP